MYHLTTKTPALVGPVLELPDPPKPPPTPPLPPLKILKKIKEKRKKAALKSSNKKKRLATKKVKPPRPGYV